MTLVLRSRIGLRITPEAREKNQNENIIHHVVKTTRVLDNDLAPFLPYHPRELHQS